MVAQRRLSRLEQDLNTLEQEVQAVPDTVETRRSQAMQDFTTRVEAIRMRLEEFADEISGQREHIAENVSELTGSVGRELFETRQPTTMTRSMQN